MSGRTVAVSDADREILRDAIGVAYRLRVAGLDANPNFTQRNPNGRLLSLLIDAADRFAHAESFSVEDDQ